MRRPIIASLAATVVIAAAAFSLQGESTKADHLNGAAYAGTNTGGGVVDFSVSADGSQVLNFHYTETSLECPPGGTKDVMIGSPIAITNHQFSTSEISGTFSPGGASGTITADLDGIPGGPTCPQRTWTAATSAQPTAAPVTTAAATAAPGTRTPGPKAPQPAAVPVTGGEPNRGSNPLVLLALGAGAVAVTAGLAGAIAATRRKS